MKPSVFDFENYRDFLRSSYEFLKKTKRSFSFRSFAKDAGFTSPNYLKMVMDGQRNLSEDSATKFSKALNLTKSESDFFENLVFYNQAQSGEEKSKYFSLMTRNKKFRNIKQLEREKFEYYSHWYYAAVRELVGLPQFRDDPSWVSKALSPQISLDQAKDALLVLKQLRLVSKDPKSGLLTRTDQTISSGAETRSVAVKAFHREILRIAADAQDHVPSLERDISGVMMMVSEEKIAELKKKISDFRRELLATLESESNKGVRLYQLSIQLFPLSKKDIA